MKPRITKTTQKIDQELNDRYIVNNNNKKNYIAAILLLETSPSSLPQKTATHKNSVFFQTVLVLLLLLLSFAHIWWLTWELTENCTSESKKTCKKSYTVCNP
jgi:hypothetical protein